MTTPCIIHGGMPKCGSSALQVALSSRPCFQNADGNQFSYVAINHKLQLFEGEELQRMARFSPRSYVASHSIEHVCQPDAKDFKMLGEKLQRAHDDHRTLVLSNEGWGTKSAIMRENRFLETLDLSARMILYVRPQVGWFNSAWWQWGAWSGDSMPTWISRRIAGLEWHRLVEECQSLPGVESVDVRLLPKEITADFFSLLGAPAPPVDAKINASLPGPVLRLYQRYPALRPGEHDSEIDFILSRYLSRHKTRAPWVLPPRVVDTLLTRFMNSNRELLALLDTDQRQQMLDDPAWWSTDSYAGKQTEPARKIEPNARESDFLAALTMEALVKLDDKYRELELRHEMLLRDRQASRSADNGADS